jgi:subtilisin family serine protease
VRRSPAVALGLAFVASGLAAAPAPAAARPATALAAAPRAVSTEVAGGAARRTDAAAPGAHPSRLLVQLRSGARGFLPGSGAVRGFARDRDLFVVEAPKGLTVAEAVSRYRAQPNVVYAEPDYEVVALAVPADPRWGEQWDLAKIAAPAAWDTQTDAGDVVVAVIDTGVDSGHADLAGNLWTDPNDGTTHGFTCGNGTVAPGGFDDHGHGTHVAGTIGAVANNGIGIAGINWEVEILSLKFLGSGGSGYISNAVNCFDKALELKLAGVNLRVTNNSWGGGGYSQALVDAMLAVEAEGIVNVCAAGKSGANADIQPMYPAGYPNRGIVSVLASDANDLGIGFTNYGFAAVDLAAPGVATLSTVPAGGCALCDPSGYRLLSGTSMASPHVAGVMAALLHLNPALTAEEARDLILDPGSYDPLTDARARSTSTGGRLNFADAIANPLLFAPVLDDFPTVTMGPDAWAAAGATVNLSATASDPDGDALRTSWARSVSTAGSGSSAGRSAISSRIRAARRSRSRRRRSRAPRPCRTTLRSPTTAAAATTAARTPRSIPRPRPALRPAARSRFRRSTARPARS